MNTEAYLDDFIKREGIYVNNLADRRGTKKYGIAEAVVHANNYKGTMSNLPLDIAKSICRKQ